MTRPLKRVIPYKQAILTLPLLFLFGCATAEVETSTEQTETPAPETEAEAPAPVPEEPESVVTTTSVYAIGDILLHDSVYNAAKSGDGYDFTATFEPIPRF